MPDTRQSRFERIALYGMVPLVAALVGALATVWAQNYLGHTAPSEAAALVLKDSSLTPSEKIKMLTLLNGDAEKFYEFLRFMLILIAVPFASICYAFANRMENKWILDLGEKVRR